MKKKLALLICVFLNLNCKKEVAKNELIDNKIEFNWIGFYNKKSKLIEFKECEFNLQSSSNPVVLQKL